MKKRLFIALLMGAIPTLIFIIASLWGGEEWEWGTARAVFFLCILPFAISGFIGATMLENTRPTRQIEQKSKSKERIGEKNNLQETTNHHKESAEPIGEKRNLHENADHQQESGLSRSIIGGILGGIVFIIVCYILFLIWYQVVFVAGGRPIPTPWPTNSVSNEAIHADVPSTAVVGENIRINARFTNLGKVSVESITVQISQDYFKGFALESSIPQYNETHPYEGFEKFQSFVFNVSIPPGETYNIEFNGRAILKGNYLVSISICARGDSDCAGFSLRTKSNKLRGITGVTSF